MSRFIATSSLESDGFFIKIIALNLAFSKISKLLLFLYFFRLFGMI